MTITIGSGITIGGGISIDTASTPTPPPPPPPVKTWVKASYLDCFGTGGVAAVSANAYQLSNMIIFGFADITTNTVNTTIQNSMQIATSNSAPNTTFLLSIGGAYYGPADINATTAPNIVANVTAQIPLYNANLSGGQITGVDLDLENGISAEAIDILTAGFKAANLKVGVAPQLVCLSGFDVNVGSPTNLGLSSGGVNNNYGNSIKAGNVDDIFVQCYNTGGYTIGNVNQSNINFFTTSAQALANCVESGYTLDIPASCNILIGEPVNLGAAFNEYNLFGVTPGSAYNQGATLANLNTLITQMKTSNYGANIAGVGGWSLNNDYFPTAFGDNYANVGGFTNTIFGNSAPQST